MGFWPILKKNFRLMFNSKLSILILIFGPLFLMGIIGAALQNTELRGIKATVFSHEDGRIILSDDDEFVAGYVEALRLNAFEVFITDSLDECKGRVQNSEAHVCIELIKKGPMEMGSIGISEYIDYETIAHVDFSKSRIVWGVIGRTQAVSERYSEVLTKEIFLEFKDEIERPMNDLQGTYNNLGNVMNYLERVDDGLEIAQREIGEIRRQEAQLNSHFTSLQAGMGTLATVGSVPGLDSSVYESINRISLSFSQANNNFNELSSLIQSAEYYEKLQQARSLSTSSRSTLSSIRSNINNVLWRWEGISEIDYENMAPLSFSYKSVEEGNIVGGIGDRKLEFLDYLFPSFIMIFIIFVSLIYSSVTIFKERSAKARIRNVTSKVGGFAVVFGNFLSIFLLLALQIMVLLGVSTIFLQASVLINLLPIVIYSLIGIALFILVGIAVGYIFNSQDGAIIASVSLSLLFLIFLPIITAPETLPLGFAQVMNVMPFVVLESKLRLASIFGLFGMPSLSEILSLGISFLICVGAIVYFYTAGKSREI